MMRWTAKLGPFCVWKVVAHRTGLDRRRLAAKLGPFCVWKVVALLGLALASAGAAAGDLSGASSARAETSTSSLRAPGAFPPGGGAGPPSRWAARGQERGIRVEPVYYGECFTNARGGISTAGATQYQGLLDLAMTLDFDRLGLPAPGKFFLLAQNTHGRGLTEDFVGDTMVLSNIDSFNNIMQVGEYWWEFSALDEAVTLRLGKQDVNEEFYYMDSARDFVQSGFTLSPNARLPSYPHQAMAIVALVQLDESLQFKFGVWDALATGGSWGFSNQDTVLVTGELEYAYALRDGALPGRIALGAGYLSEGEAQGEPFGAAHGYSLQWEQQLFRERAKRTADLQGLGLFAAYYPRFPSAPILPDTIGDSFATGLVYTGLFSRRDRDALGAGVVWSELFQGGTDRETAIELFYRAFLTDRVSLQPDVQSILSPSGIHPDAFVAGVRLQVNL